MHQESLISSNLFVDKVENAIRESIASRDFPLEIFSSKPSKDDKYTYLRILGKTFARFARLKKGLRLEVPIELKGNHEDFATGRISSHLLYHDCISQNDLLGLISNLVNVTIDSFVSFEVGCCSLYEQCSDAKHCISKYIDTMLACCYRQNLEKGKIFYGRNRNA